MAQSFIIATKGLLLIMYYTVIPLFAALFIIGFLQFLIISYENKIVKFIKKIKYVNSLKRSDLFKLKEERRKNHAKFFRNRQKSNNQIYSKCET